jgi:hypothetical protein
MLAHRYGITRYVLLRRCLVRLRHLLQVFSKPIFLRILYPEAHKQVFMLHDVLKKINVINFLAQRMEEQEDSIGASSTYLSCKTHR